MTNSQILTLDQAQIWSEYTCRLPQSQQDIYFSPDYYRLYEEKGDGKAMCFVFEKDRDLALFPFLINNIALCYALEDDYFDIQGAYGYNGLVTSSVDSQFINSFFDSYREYVKRQKVVCEFVRFHPILANQDFHSNYLDVIYDRSTVLLDLEIGYDNIFANQYSSQNRNMIRKAIKNNYQYTVTNRVEDYIEFSRLYNASMKRLGAESSYLFPNDYFSGFGKNLKDKSFVVIVCKDGVSLAGAIFLLDGLYCHYHLSGRSNDCNDNSVTNFILDIAIKKAIEMGANKFHLGGGRTNKTDDSLLKFKKNFSSTICSFYIGTKIYLPEVYEEINSQWRNRYPQSSERYAGRVQGYRIQNT